VASGFRAQCTSRRGHSDLRAACYVKTKWRARSVGAAFALVMVGAVPLARQANVSAAHGIPNTRLVAARPRRVVALLGDGYTAGIHGGRRGDWFKIVCRREKWHCIASGQPDSGYVYHRNGAATFQQRVGRLIGRNPSLVVLEGGHDDLIEPPKAVEGAAKTLIKTIRVALPASPIVVLGAVMERPERFTQLDEIDRAIRRAAMSASDTYYVDPVRQRWLWKATTPRTATDHQFISKDGVHPNAAGYQRMARIFTKDLSAFGLGG
jgi:lysophospholipase L1-like esterase